MLGLLLAYIFGFLLSMKGIFALLLGMVLYLALPVIPRALGIFHSFANFHLWSATGMLQRAAIVVSEHGDLLMKRMKFDDLGVEKISVGDEEKEFEDPDSALHSWFGIPFALADEVHGVLFDPRHAALGQRRADAAQRGENSAEATSEEWERYEVHEWKRGVFEMPRDVFELVTLGSVRHLVDGGERAEYPGRVESLYELSRSPFQSSTRASKFIMIIIALVGPFAALGLLASQFSGGGGGGGGTTITPGALLLAGGLTEGGRTVARRIADGIRAIDWLHVAKVMLVLLPLPLLFLVLLAVSPIMAIFFFLTLGAGFWFLPILFMVLRSSSIIGGMIAPLLMRSGMAGYEQPVFVWTPERYHLVEFDDLEDVDENRLSWYSLCGATVGFTFDPRPESWGAEVLERDRIEAQTEVATDGGTSEEDNIPQGYVRAPQIRRGDIYAAFVPEDLERSCYYLHSGIAQSRFTDTATGGKSLSRLLKAKEVYGGDSSLDDKHVVYAMLVCGLISFAAGFFTFFM